jgi:apolipoprotein N-acyltransferase
VRVVQPNAPQHEKWDPEKAPVFFWRQVDATAAGDVPDLVVWPETAIPQLLNYAGDTLEVVTEAARGAPVALGMLREDDGRGHNSLIVLDGQGEISEIYDKHHLVPFGEYMPFPGLFRSLGIRGLAERADMGYAPGPGPEVVRLGGLDALALICYEAVFPRNTRVDGARPDLLLQITNDAWFGTSSGPQQHLAQARMRAIEQGLPLVRSANTGISAVIDPRGRIVTSIPLGTHGFVDAGLPMPVPPPLYARTGDWPVAALLAIGLVALAGRALTMNKD